MAIQTVFLTYKGIDINVVGDYMKGDDPDWEYPGYYSEFNIEKIIVEGVDIHAITSIEDDCDIAEKCLEKLEG